MHGRAKANATKRRASLKTWGITVIAGIMAFALAWAADERDIPRKWVTALMATIFTFGLVIYMRRYDGPRRWSFWAAVAICLALHTAVQGIFFGYLLANVRTFSILYWFPVMLLEMVPLLIAIKRIDEKITGRKHTVRLRF